MLEFIYDLYKNDSFTVYLTIALVVLIVLFVIVLIFGKRDKRLEETRKLEKISVDTFKETDNTLNKVEVSLENSIPSEPLTIENNPERELLDASFTDEEKTMIADAEKSLDTANANTLAHVESPENITLENTDVIPEPENVNVTVFEPTTLSDAIPNETTLPSPEEITPVESEIEKDLQEISNLKELIDKVEIPNKTINEEITSKPIPEVFSSVYVNKKENIEKPVVEQPVVMEAPEQKEEQKEEQKVEQTNDDVIIDQPFFLIQDDDEDMELPSLK